jgi:hypothetical protein
MLRLLEIATDFLVLHVIVNGIVAHWLAIHITKAVKYFFAVSEDRAAILVHFIERSRNQGHQPWSVLECSDGKCRLI